MQRWTEQSRFTDPGRHAAPFALLGPAPEDAALAIQGLLIHGEALQRYGLEPRPFIRDTLAVETRLAEVLAADDRPLSMERPVRARALGTCRDYAVLLCAAMRQHGRPARVRCGFAAYFAPGSWQDHWICEVWSGDRWRRIDAQLDRKSRQALGVEFDPCDLPPAVYLTGEEAWRACRDGRIDPALVGRDRTRGLWFALVNLVRDRLALADRFTSDWDGWRAAAPATFSLGPEMLEAADRMAGEDPLEPPSLAPWWLGG